MWKNVHLVLKDYDHRADVIRLAGYSGQRKMRRNPKDSEAWKRKKGLGWGLEMAQGFEALTALPKVLSPIPSSSRSHSPISDSSETAFWLAKSAACSTQRADVGSCSQAGDVLSSQALIGSAALDPPP